MIISLENLCYANLSVAKKSIFISILQFHFQLWEIKNKIDELFKMKWNVFGVEQNFYRNVLWEVVWMFNYLLLDGIVVHSITKLVNPKWPKVVNVWNIDWLHTNIFNLWTLCQTSSSWDLGNVSECCATRLSTWSCCNSCVLFGYGSTQNHC